MKLEMLIAFCAIATTVAFSQGDPHAEALRLAQPGPEHKILAGLAGTWDVETKLWQQPGAPPMTMKGAMTNELIYLSICQRCSFSNLSASQGLTLLHSANRCSALPDVMNHYWTCCGEKQKEILSSWSK